MSSFFGDPKPPYSSEARRTAVAHAAVPWSPSGPNLAAALLLLSTMGSACGRSAPEPLHTQAVIVAVGQYDFGYGSPPTALGVAVRYVACPSVTETFRLEAISDAGVGALHATPAQRACFEGLQVGSTVPVVGTTWTTGCGGSVTGWNIERVGPCTTGGLDGTTRFSGEESCPWM